jgi:mersacidin/lichenicidin family type 2 lantibiotic
MHLNVVRAWKDPSYRNQLTMAQLRALPPNPAGSSEITKEQLAEIDGLYIFSHSGESLLMACCGVIK